ncbi:hypothetical protein EDD86DRAFT_243954 [Gorgonomyces haynaldii]|nr:hypothetical protein EDD86DRAFT_243954 [Gorgonomyces haynaldii]
MFPGTSSKKEKRLVESTAAIPRVHTRLVSSQAALQLFPAHEAVQTVPANVFQQLFVLSQHWNISPLLRERLPNLVGRSFVFLVDDSASMLQHKDGSRWQEMISFFILTDGEAYTEDGRDMIPPLVQFLGSRHKMKFMQYPWQLPITFVCCTGNPMYYQYMRQLFQDEQLGIQVLRSFREERDLLKQINITPSDHLVLCLLVGFDKYLRNKLLCPEFSPKEIQFQH